MKKLAILILAIAVLGFQLFPQPGSGGMFTVHRNIVYCLNNNKALTFDLYVPGGQTMASGIGVDGKHSQQGKPGVAGASAMPVLIWIPEYGKEIFPAPLTAFTGNGYALESL